MGKNGKDRCSVCGALIVFGCDGLCLACEKARQEQVRREQERKRREAFGSPWGGPAGSHSLSQADLSLAREENDCV